MARLKLPSVAILFLISGLLLLRSWQFSNAAPERDVPSEMTVTSVGRAWPMFGGSPSRNMVNRTDRNIPTDWSRAWKVGPDGRGPDLAKSKNVKWVARLGRSAFGGPVVADGRIFVGTNNTTPRDPRVKEDKAILMAFQTDGRFLWQAVHDSQPNCQRDPARTGLCSTPAIEGDRLYYVTPRSELVCASTKGRPDTHEPVILWKLDMMKELGVRPRNMSACAPLVLGDRVFICTANGRDEDPQKLPDPQAPSFLAVDRWTGKVLWQDNSPGVGILLGQLTNSPTYAFAGGHDMVIFPGGDGWLRAFTPATGKLLWKFDANPKAAVFRLRGDGDRNDFFATAVVHVGRLYIGTAQDPDHGEGVGHMWCLDLARAVEKGRTNLDHDVSPVDDNFDPKAAVNKDSALHWHYGGAVPQAEQAKVGRDWYFGRTLSTVAAQDGLVYTADLSGYLHCLDARTGKAYWTHDLKAAVWGSPYLLDGKVYVGTEDGDMWIFQHGKEKKELARIEMDEPIFTTPVAVDGVFYLTAGSYLIAIVAK